MKFGIKTKIRNLLQGKDSGSMTDYELLSIKGFGRKALEVVRHDEKLRKAVHVLDNLY